jgi:hypothetical protein
VRHLVGLTGIDQLEVRRSEENSIDAWNFFFLNGDHVLMIMRKYTTLRYTNILKLWVPKDLPEINTKFFVN